MKKPTILTAEAKYEISREEIEKILLEKFNFPNGSVEWDVSNKGTVRGVIVKFIRTEIQG